jgi:BlaI family transcriptional regulator, penicillinase repressor
MMMVEASGGVRHSILDMAPLELDCMNALWPLGEATVRDVHQALAESRPRAYTTIMTILDRLAQKKVVSRRKVGRAWVYTPNVSVDEARSHAVAQIVAGFFDGSTQALAAHLSNYSDFFSPVSPNSGDATGFSASGAQSSTEIATVKSSTPGGEGDASA